jgi:hypothetical protein
MHTNWFLSLIAVAVFCGRLTAQDAPPMIWELGGRLFETSRQNPAPDPDGNEVWHFLRTTSSEGPVGSRRWLQDGRYVSLSRQSERLFDQPVSGFIFQDAPTFLAPFVARVTKEHSVGLTFRVGDVMLAPGPEHAVVLGWRSPVAGLLTAEGAFEHAQNCCGINSQVNWYVERGPEPDPAKGFKPVKLVAGTSDFGSDGQVGKFLVEDEPIQAGEFLYFIVDAKADGTGTMHHGDATRFNVAITVHGGVPSAPPIFEKDIVPILAAHCHECHGEETQESQLDLRTLTAMLRGGEQGPAIVRGHPEQSYLIDLVQRGEMPPDQDARLSSSERSLLRRWIRAGAPAEERVGQVQPKTSISEDDRSYWAFQTPIKHDLPAVNDNERVRTPIDRFVLAKLERKGLTFSPDVDRVALIRRASFDLIGLPPTPDEVEAFEEESIRNPQSAFHNLLDRVLASPHYGERWGRHWLDAAGYVDVRLFDGDAGTIYLNDGMWRFRDYVFRAHNADMPWDRFITEQLAGDALVDWRSAETFTPEIIELLTATSYLRNIEDHTSEPQYGVKQRYDVLFGLMEMVSTSLLGMTLECCRCHNHKFDPLPQRDYYRFMAHFESAYNVHNWTKPQDRWLPDVSPQQRAEIDERNAESDGQIAALDKQRKQAEGAKQADRVAELQTAIANLKAQKRSYGKIQALVDVGEGPVSRVLRRGDYQALGIIVQPGGLEVVSHATPPAEPSSETPPRLELAKWLTNSTHPLTPRVIVNRAWHHHFGVGIVATPGNFGRSGSPPTHPELLDWLAADFVEHGWSLKRLHKQIMMSTVYRQASRRPAEEQALAEQVDPENKLLWRMNLRRIEAEIVRDAVLAVSGNLDRRQGGAPVMLTTPTDGLSMVKRQDNKTDHHRRSVYLLARRVYPLKFLEVFDSPIMSINCTRRDNSATVLQSFAFLNSEFVAAHASQLAARVGNQDDVIQHAYRLILSRRPDNDEVESCRGFLSDQASLYVAEGADEAAARTKALSDLCQMLLCTNEFLYID